MFKTIIYIIFLSLFSIPSFSNISSNTKIINFDNYNLNYDKPKIGFFFNGTTEEELKSFINKLYELRFDKLGFKYIYLKNDIKLTDEFFQIKYQKENFPILKYKKYLIKNSLVEFQKKFAENIIYNQDIILNIDLDNPNIVDIISNPDIIKIAQNNNIAEKVFENFFVKILKKQIDKNSSYLVVYNKWFEREIQILKTQVSIENNFRVYNLWTQKNLGLVDLSFTDNFLSYQVKIYLVK